MELIRFTVIIAILCIVIGIVKLKCDIIANYGADRITVGDLIQYVLASCVPVINCIFFLVMVCELISTAKLIKVKVLNTPFFFKLKLIER